MQAHISSETPVQPKPNIRDTKIIYSIICSSSLCLTLLPSSKLLLGTMIDTKNKRLIGSPG